MTAQDSTLYRCPKTCESIACWHFNAHTEKMECKRNVPNQYGCPQCEPVVSPAKYGGFHLCAFCNKPVDNGVLVCPHCRHNPNKGFDIPVVSLAPSKPENPEPELHLKNMPICDNCGHDKSCHDEMGCRLLPTRQYCSCKKFETLTVEEQEKEVQDIYRDLEGEPANTENPEPELTPEPEQVTALEPTQTKRLIAGGFNQGAKSQLLRSQIELPAIKIYWYNKGFEAGSKPRVSVEQIADILDARYKKYVMSTCLNGAQFNLDTAKLIKELLEAV